MGFSRLINIKHARNGRWNAIGAYDLQYAAVGRLDPREVRRTERATRDPYRLILISVVHV